MHKTLPPGRNFFALDRERSHAERAKAIILPAPFERTPRGLKGTRRAPETILRASRGLSSFDAETGRDVSSSAGIATLFPLTFSRLNEDAALDRLHSVVADLLTLGKFVVTLGGEHGLTAPIVAAHAKRAPQLSVLHLDSRPDLLKARKQDRYERHSVMARVSEFVDPHRIVQAGIRASTAEEAEIQRETGVHVYHAHAIRSGAYTKLLRAWDDLVVEDLTEEVYVTIDMSVFDPSAVPSTDSSEPGGLLWHEVTQCLRKVADKRTVIGCDIVELVPHSAHPRSDVAAARLVHKILSYVL